MAEDAPGSPEEAPQVETPSTAIPDNMPPSGMSSVMPSPATVVLGDSRAMRPMPPVIEEPVEMDDDPTRGEKRRTSDGAEEPPHKMNSGQAETRNLF